LRRTPARRPRTGIVRAGGEHEGMVRSVGRKVPEGRKVQGARCEDVQGWSLPVRRVSLERGGGGWDW